MRREQTWAALALLGVTVAWGATFVVVQAAVEVMPVYDFLFWRFAIAGVLLALLYPASLRRLSRADYRNGAVLALILALSYAAQTFGLRYTSASVSGFITGMFLVFVPLIGALLFRRKVGAAAWSAVGLATVGLALLSLKGFAFGFGEFLTLLCAIGFALHLVLLGEWSTTSTAYGLTILQLVGVALLTGAAGMADGRLELPPDRDLWLVVGFMAIVATLVAFLVQTWAIPLVGPVRGAVILTGEPVFAGIFGVLVAGDVITWRTALGAACILAAMLLVELAPRRVSAATGPPAPAPPSPPARRSGPDG